MKIEQLCNCFVLSPPRIFHLLTKYLLSLKSLPLLPCRPAPPSSSTSPPLSPKTHKLHCFANCICNSPLLQSVLACTVSSGLLGCSVAPCVGHVSSPPSSPPLPFPSSSPPSPSSCLLAAPRRSTRDFTNPPSCSQLDLTCHI